ncbi:MAG TPA: DUF4270 family protein [Chitinophagaceae bacterium]|nr:DUF4270 family protein [Chitinophagaceae bacterium]
MIRSKLPLAFTGVIFLSLLSWHCTKIDSTNLGGSLIPPVDNVNTFETILNVVANNIDSVPFGKDCGVIYPTDDQALGYIGNDPYFGTTKATMYAEFKPLYPFTFLGLKAERTLDSIVLVLGYKKAFGDSMNPQSVRVYEIATTTASPFKPDTSTCSVYPFNPVALGSAIYAPAGLKDTITLRNIFMDSSANHQLRIKLSASLGLRLLSQDTIRTDSAFREVLKGFAIVPENIGNALSYFNLEDFNTKLAVYYKFKNTTGKIDTTVNYFRFTAAANSANNIVRNRNGAEMNSFTNTKNPAGDNFIYLQTAPGSYAELKIPGLAGLSNRIVHRAELILEQVYSPLPVNQLFSPPDFLYLDIKDSIYHPIPCDFSVIQGQPDIISFGGYKTIVKVSGQNIARYTFTLSRYIQRLITNKKSIPTIRVRAPHYILNPAGYVDQCNAGVAPFFYPLNNIAEGRVKLVGGTYSPGTSSNSIRLRIVYSNL